jgi:hypothetical protein
MRSVLPAGWKEDGGQEDKAGFFKTIQQMIMTLMVVFYRRKII